MNGHQRVRARSVSRLVSALLLILLAAAITGCDAFLLGPLLDGESGEPLSIDPESTVVAIGATTIFTATGGYPPYAFAVDSGDGSIDSSSGVYTAPSADGRATISVTDFVGNSRTATVTVNVPPDYEVTVPAFPVTDYGGNLGEMISDASFDHGGSPTHQIRIEEIDSNAGLQDITWKIYQSDDPFLDGLDAQAASGTIPRLLGGTSAVVDVDFSLPGTWGYWYYIVTISAGDDADISNNSLTVGPVPVWQITGNAEFDTDEDDIYTFQAEDFAVLLNPSDNVFFNGLIDLNTMRDSFIVRTGPSITEFQIRATWVSFPAKDNLALQVFDETGAFVNQSNEAGSNMEPDGGGYWTLSGLTPNSFYYVDAIAMAPGDDVGDAYTIEVIAGP